MASIGLKLFYLRTREKKLSQRDVAKQLGVRQGTVSFLEQGVSNPNWALVVDICKYFDVTPTYLADESRGVIPRPTERWGLRDSLVTLDMWVEVARNAVHDCDDKTAMCQLGPGTSFFDDEAAEIRRRYKRASNSKTALDELRDNFRAAERKLEKELERELGEHPRRRGKPKE